MSRQLGGKLRQIYSRLLDQMQSMRVPWTEVAVQAPEQPTKFRNLARARRTIEDMDWEQCDGFSLRMVLPGRDIANWAFFDWTMLASVSREHSVSRDTLIRSLWRASLSLYPAEMGLGVREAETVSLEFARSTVDEYGCHFRMRRACGPAFSFAGMQLVGTGRSDDEDRNIGAWAFREEHFKHVLLRDVYPLNFLTQPYLDRPVEGSTLERWIRADTSRGTLEPLTDKVTIWRPVVENIPLIRERLFRAGVLFYWRHFDPFDPMYRDFSKPWKPPDEIPGMFRAEFYGRDPSITR